MRKILLIAALLLGIGCTATPDSYLEPGISRELAQWRKATIHNPSYHLLFDLVDNWGWVAIRFTLDTKQDIVVDFRNTDLVEEISLGASNDPITEHCTLTAEHIVIPRQLTHIGEQSINIKFRVDNQSLNRQEEYLYTLLVPDRARTLFPCFEQPDMKASFELSLIIPEEWEAVSNTPTTADSWAEETYEYYTDNTLPEGLKIVSFCPTEPLSTYLFSFVAGKLSKSTYDDGRHTFSAYYRETDPERLKQLDTIFEQVAASLDWLEEYTGIEYPFAKYDLIILPGFQYGGMEHTGATLYNDTQMFLSANPTPDEELRRIQLIAHETAHMWFGDYVTMRWFDDVWTKEVFANYFAARMAEPLFPNVNHTLNRLKTYTASALNEDRTKGTTSIRQELDNLRNAGLIYGQIIYNKAPVVMQKLHEIMGEEAFRQGIQEYLSTYAYDNASWADLIAILDRLSDTDLRSFSQVWVNEPGMPHVSVIRTDNTITVSDSDPLGRGLSWPQRFTVTAVTRDGTKHDIEVEVTSEPTTYSLTDDTKYIIPNSCGRGYGLFLLSDSDLESLRQCWMTIDDDTARQATVMNLYENYLAGRISDWDMLTSLMLGLVGEHNPLIASTVVSYIAEPLQSGNYPLEELSLLNEAEHHPLVSCRQQILRMIMQAAKCEDVTAELYKIWKEANHPLLNVNDYMTLAYELSLRLPERYEEIASTQRSRISDPDRLRRFDYIIRAVNPNKAERDALFESLLEPENRRIEPWAASALAYLNHPLRGTEAVEYIRRGLDELLEVQHTGDIFFPRNWVGALLGGHRSKEAYDVLERFLDENPDYPQLMRNKILQAAYPLQRHNR
ncbi:MAG: aminopeptidase [Alistipes sp.]|nr:aminopeptidase [Alistipes sp.]